MRHLLRDLQGAGATERERRWLVPPELSAPFLPGWDGDHVPGP